MSAPRRYPDESSERGWTRIASQKFSGPSGLGTKCLVCAPGSRCRPDTRARHGRGRGRGPQPLRPRSHSTPTKTSYEAVQPAQELIPFAQLHRASPSPYRCSGPNGLGVADEIALGYQARQPHQEGVSTSSTDAHKELLAVQSYEATRKGMTEWTVRRVGRRPGCNAALPAGCHDELDGNRLRPHPETDR